MFLNKKCTESAAFIQLFFDFYAWGQIYFENVDASTVSMLAGAATLTPPGNGCSSSWKEEVVA